MNYGILPNHQVTQVVLDEANYTYVGSATGEASSVNILGIGPFGAKALVQEAKEDLLENVDLYSGSRALVNVVIDHKYTYFSWIYVKKTVYVSADVVEFNK